MPVVPHIIRAALGLGITEAARPELVALGSANLRGENVRRIRQGEASTRYGFAALPNGLIDATSPVAGSALIADRQTVMRIADGTAQVFDVKSQTWVPMPGRPSECAMSLVDLPNPTSVSSQIEDVAIANGYCCTLWLGTDGSNGYSFAALTNATTGSVVSPPVQIQASGAPMAVVAVGSTFIIVQSTGTSHIKAYRLDTSTPSSIEAGWIAMADLATDGTNALAACSLTTYAVLAYVNTSGGASQVTVVAFDATGALASTTINTNTETPATVDVRGSETDTVWVAWDEPTGQIVRIVGLDPAGIGGTPLAATATILAIGADPLLSIGIQPGAPGKGRLFVSDTNTAHVPSYIRGFKTVAGAAAADGAQSTIYAVSACGRPFSYASRFYIPVTVSDTSNLQQQIVIVDWTDDVTYLRPVAAPAPGLSIANIFAVNFRHCSVPSPSAGVFVFGMGVVKSALANASTLARLDFGAANRWQPAPWGNSVYMTGGVAQYSDGRRIAEAGFLVRPHIPSLGTTGTGITAVTGWRYVCVYEEVDADGNWHVSGLSSPSASTGAVSNKTVTVGTRPLTVSSRVRTGGAAAAGVRVAYYRTLDGGEAPYYRVGSLSNSTASFAVTFSDTTTDAVLATKSQLYSQPGVLGTAQDRRPPPFFNAIASYNGMLVGASGSDVWYSGQPVTGEGAWFNPIFQIPIPGDSDITALAVMDGTLFVFKRREVYAMAGDPPSDNGSSGGLGVPRRLACDVGSIGPITGTTAMGVFFQSERGIELLTRAQTVQWIGQHVQTTLAAYPVMTSATVEPTPTGALLLIEVAAAQSAGQVTGSGRTLVFDIALGDWVSTDRRTSAASVADAPSQSACMIYTGTAWRYAWMTANGRVHYEDRTTYRDADGSFVVPLIETGWFDAYTNEASLWSASILLQQYTAAGLRIESAYDWGDYDALDDAVWTETEAAGERQLELRAEPRGESVKFRITATAPASPDSGQGFGFFALALDTRPKQGPAMGTARLDPAKRR